MKTQKEGKLQKAKGYLLRDISVNNLSTIQKYIIFIIFCFYIVLCVGIFFNFIALADFFYKGDVYSEKCENVSSTTNNSKKFKCDEQNKSVEALNSIVICANFVMSAVAGVFFDYYGPKTTALIGHSFNILAWILIGLHSDSTNTLLFGMVLLGLSADSTFIPVMNVVYLFYNNITIFTVAMGCCASLSFAIPIFLELLVNTNDSKRFKWVCYLYCFVILVPFFFVILFLLPWKNLKDQLEDEKKDKEMLTTQQQLEQPKYKNSYSFKEKKGNDSWDTFADEEGKHFHKLSNEINEEKYMNTLDILGKQKMNSSEMQNMPIQKPLRKIETEEKVNTRHKDSHIQNFNMNPSKELEHIAHNYDVDFTEKKNASIHTIGSSNMGSNEIKNKNKIINVPQKRKELFAEIKNTFISIKYVAILYYFLIFNFSLINYQMCSKLFFKDYEIINDLLKIFGPVSVVPCALLGIIIHKYDIFPIIFLLLCSSIFMYVFAIFLTSVTAYLSSFCFLITTSCYTTQLYCYAQVMFPHYHFGKVVGTISMLSGVVSLLTIPIYNNYTLDYNNKDPNPFGYIMIGLLTSTFPILFYVFWYYPERIKA